MDTTNERVNFFTIAKLVDVQECVEFCRKYNMLPGNEPKNCVNCNRESQVVVCENSRKPNFPYGLRCRCCNKRNSITTNTWFEGTKLTIQQNIGLIHCWLHGMGIQRTSSELDLSLKTVMDYFGFCRDVCYVICTNSSEPIGGPGKTVELDESYITTSRFNKTSVVRNELKQIWVFGGIERQSKKYFIVRVYRRDKDALVNLMKHFILPGSWVNADVWKRYSELQNEGYIHDLAKHRIEFITNEDSGMESLWKSMKESIKKVGRQGVCEDTYIFQYLYLHQLKLRNYRHPCEQLPVFLQDISKVFAGYGRTNLLPKSYTGSDLQNCIDI